VGEADQPAANGGEGVFGRARSSPRLVIAIAAGVLLVCAWIGWAIYVTSEHGASAGLGVLIAWPAILTALALVSLPLIGVYLLIRPRSDGEASATDADEDDVDPKTEDPAEEDEASETKAGKT
jgi:hypothetical protein